MMWNRLLTLAIALMFLSHALSTGAAETDALTSPDERIVALITTDAGGQMTLCRIAATALLVGGSRIAMPGIRLRTACVPIRRGPQNT
jgi:hypothetical protein